MWQLLSDFSKGVLFHIFSEKEDLPMAKVVKNLQEKEYAKSVYVYTSLYTFVITLQTEYKGSPKDGISISFDIKNNEFQIGYYDVKTNLGVNYRCIEKQTASLVDALVLRLFLTENNKVLKIEPEDNPSFEIGEEVETVIDDYNRKYRKGKICDMQKHYQQRRFIYFLNIDGKKLKKRFFKDNLRKI